MQQAKPKILLMGCQRSGKTSIQKVVFHKMSPHDSLQLEPTTKVVKNDVGTSAFVQFQIWDFPGKAEVNDALEAEADFATCGALIFVIDAQDEYTEAFNRLIALIKRAYKLNPRVSFEIFIHKVDGLHDDQKIEIQRDLLAKATQEMNDNNLDNVLINFFLTSIYDHSIFEAFSKVVQKLLPELPHLEQLMDVLVNNCRIEKGFLFDVLSKIYIATDSSPVDIQSYELCSDIIDVVIDVSSIYGTRGEGEVAFDSQSTSMIKLNNGMLLYLREVNRFQALVCIMREDNLDRLALIEYNLSQFTTALAAMAATRLQYPISATSTRPTPA